MQFSLESSSWIARCVSAGHGEAVVSGFSSQASAAHALLVECIRTRGGYVDLGDVFVAALPNLGDDGQDFALAYGPFVEGTGVKAPNVRQMKPLDMSRDYLLTEKVYAWDGELVGLLPADLQFVVEAVTDLQQFRQLGDQRLRMRAVVEAKARAESYRSAFAREEDDPAVNGGAPFFASMMASLAQGRRTDMLLSMAGLASDERQSILRAVFDVDASAAAFDAEELNRCVWRHAGEQAWRIRDLRALMEGSTSSIKAVRTEAGAWSVWISNSVLLDAQSPFEVRPTGHGYSLLDGYASLCRAVSGERLIVGFGFAGAREIRVPLGRSGVSQILGIAADRRVAQQGELCDDLGEMACERARA